MDKYFKIVVEALAVFKLGTGRSIAFWLGPWVNKISQKTRFPELFQIAQCPNGSVVDHMS